MKSPLIDNVKKWIEDRTGLISAAADFLHEEIPGGTRFSYTLGSACMFLLTIQIVTGIWQCFFYVPTVDYAYSSLNYLRLQVPFGWLIHGLHSWGGNLFTIVVGLHCLRVFIWGSYKKPRELVWLMGLFIIIMTALFMFTGPVLPWDKKGYWAGQVGIGIAGSVPIVGPFTQMLMQGASKMGQLALTRMYVMHVALLPGLIGLFVFLHLVAFRKNGEAGPWKEEERKKVGYFWPEQIFKDVLISLLLFILLVGLTAYFPPEFSGLADPTDTLITPKPAWNFLFLYQLLKYLPGPLEFVGTALVPTFIVLLFGSLPFLDRSPERNPFKRVFVLSCGFLFVGIILFLTWQGYIFRSDAEKAHMDNGTEIVASNNAGGGENTPSAADHEKAVEMANKSEDITGEKLFKTLGCTECHTVTGKPGDKQGPDLLMSKGNNRTREWLEEQITYPQKHNPKTIMPPYSHLSERNVGLLVKYLQDLTLPAGVPVAAAAVTAPAADAKAVVAADAGASQDAGEALFNAQGCTQCHTIKGSPSHKAGPDLVMAIVKDKPSKEWLKDQLVNPQGHNATSIMPSYSGRMQEDQINTMVDFLSSLSTRKVEAVPEGQEAAAEGSEGGAAKKGPGESAFIIGDKEHGAILFHQNCLMCHGPHGNVTAKGFAAPKGVPSLNPIDRNIASQDVQAFVDRIDIYMQHGAPALAEGGPAMPDFGDSHALTQAQIADLEAYILSVNGVDRTKIIHPGVDPKEFFLMLVEITSVIIFLSVLYWLLIKLLKI